MCVNCLWNRIYHISFDHLFNDTPAKHLKWCLDGELSQNSQTFRVSETFNYTWIEWVIVPWTIDISPTSHGYFNGNSRILKWRYVSTICVAIFWGYIPWTIALTSIGLILMATVPPINRFLKWPLIIGPAIYPADATWLPGGKDCLRRRLSSPNGHMRQWAIERSDVVLPPVVFYCAGMEWLNPSQPRLICFSCFLLWFWMDKVKRESLRIDHDWSTYPHCVFSKRLKLLSTNMWCASMCL